MRRGIRWGLVALLLGGCQALVPAPGGRGPARLTIAPVAPAPAAQVRVRVDPLHGAAFVEGGPGATSEVLVEPQEVSHALEAGRTTVWLQVTYTGEGTVAVAPALDSNRTVLGAGLPGAWPAMSAGEVQRVPLTFENPSADGFEFVVALQVTASAPAGAVDRRLAQVASGVASASSSHGALTPPRAIDADAATQWACAEWRPTAAWLAVDLGESRVMDAVLVKLPPFGGGASYRVETSVDGARWEPVTGPLRNTSWQVERKAFSQPVTARHVRLVFTNDPVTPEARFSVFSLAVPVPTSPPGPSPSPTPSAAPSASPSPVPSPTPSSGPSAPLGAWVRDFEGEPLGSDPGDWVDPRDEGFSFDWMPRVVWRLVDAGGSRQYLHDGLADRAFLSFRRYRGRGFGTDDGRLPTRYLAALDVTPVRSYTYSPTGDQGTQVYYLDPSNYLEVLIKPTWYEVWAAVNAAPFQSRGWARLFAAPVTTAAGQRRRLGAEVDCAAGLMKVYLDNQLLTTVASSMLTDRPHWFALRGAGNIVMHDNLRVEPR